MFACEYVYVHLCVHTVLYSTACVSTIIHLRYARMSDDIIEAHYYVVDNGHIDLERIHTAHALWRINRLVRS